MIMVIEELDQSIALFTSESAPSCTNMIKFLDWNNESLLKDYEVKPIVIKDRENALTHCRSRDKVRS